MIMHTHPSIHSLDQEEYWNESDEDLDQDLNMPSLPPMALSLDADEVKSQLSL